MQRIALARDAGLPITYHNAGETVANRRGLTLYRVPVAWRERFPPQAAARAPPE